MHTWSERISPAGIVWIVGLLAVCAAALCLPGAWTEARTTDTASTCQWVEVGQLPEGVWDAAASFVEASGAYTMYVQGGLTSDAAAGAVLADEGLLAVDFGGDAGPGTPVPVATVPVAGGRREKRWGHAATFADGYEPLSVIWLGGSAKAPPEGAWPPEWVAAGVPAQPTLPGPTARPTATRIPLGADRQVAWFKPGVNTWTTNSRWNLPKPLMDHASAYASGWGVLVVQGGKSSQGALGSESAMYWAQLGGSQPLEFDAGIPTNGPNLYGHSLVWDSHAERLVIFGGTRDGARGVADLWQLGRDEFSRNDGWKALPASGSPPAPRYQHAAVYDPVRKRIIVFGGMAGDRVLSGTWSLELDDEANPRWEPIEAEIAGRAAASMVFDTKSGRAILVGGRDQQGHGFREIVALDCSGEVRPTPTGAATDTPTPMATDTSATEPARPTQPRMSATPSASSSPNSSLTVQPSPLTPVPTDTVEPTAVAPTGTPTTPAPRPGRSYLPVVLREPSPVPTPVPTPTPSATAECTLHEPAEPNDRWLDVRYGPGLCENPDPSRSGWIWGRLSPEDTQDVYKVIVHADGSLQAVVDVPSDADYDLFFGYVMGDEHCEWTTSSVSYGDGLDEMLRQAVEAGTYCMMVATSREHAGGGVREYGIRWHMLP